MIAPANERPRRIPIREEPPGFWQRENGLLVECIKTLVLGLASLAIVIWFGILPWVAVLFLIFG